MLLGSHGAIWGEKVGANRFLTRREPPVQAEGQGKGNISPEGQKAGGIGESRRPGFWLELRAASEEWRRA